MSKLFKYLDEEFESICDKSEATEESKREIRLVFFTAVFMTLDALRQRDVILEGAPEGAEPALVYKHEVEALMEKAHDEVVRLDDYAEEGEQA